MVISSGMQSMDTMKQVYQIVKPLNPNFCFLQCTSAYPLQPEDVNLRVIAVSMGEAVVPPGHRTMVFLLFLEGGGTENWIRHHSCKAKALLQMDTPHLLP